MDADPSDYTYGAIVGMIKVDGCYPATYCYDTRTRLPATPSLGLVQLYMSRMMIRGSSLIGVW